MDLLIQLMKIFDKLTSRNDDFNQDLLIFDKPFSENDYLFNYDLTYFTG